MSLYRYLCVALSLVIIGLAGVGRAADSPVPKPVWIKGGLAHPTRLLAKVRPVAKSNAHASALATEGLRTVAGFDLVPGLVVLDADPQSHMQAMAAAAATDGDDQAAQLQTRIEALRASGLFEYVEPDYLFLADAAPNDSAFTDGTLWGLRNTGQVGGTSGVDIDAVRAWDITTGSANVIVGVIDTGIRYTHQDLAANMWHNPGEVAGNGLDDDHNGYIDDVFGINAISGSGDPMDDDGHGTHVAGTIGAVANNGQPHVGVAWTVRLMALKFIPPNNGGDTADAIECMNYAVAKGAKILNSSWGQAGRSQALQDAIAAAQSQGVLVVAAAGNDGGDNDSTPHFPSGFDLDNVISVAAIDRYGSRASFSNYGARTVDLGAPGLSIYSTVNASDIGYATYQGTSMAAPHVAGVAALIRAQYPTINLADLRDRLLNTTTPTSGLQSITVTGGRVNAYQALTTQGDGQLEISVTPISGTTFYYGRTTTVVARVTDLIGVAGAVVTGTLSGGGAVTFLDNGIAPDLAANDSRYTGTFVTPAAGTQFSLTIGASAPGKSAALTDFTYPLQAPPANDHFASRIAITFNNGSTTANNAGATLEPGEPVIAGEPGGASLWWTWTAPANTSVTISTEGSPFDTLLGVYTGGSVNALTEIASNDDISGPNQPSKVTFNATAGTVFQIVVDGWEGKTGAITLSLATTIPPANDNFADRTVVSGTGFAVNGNNLNATLESGEPAGSPFGGYHSVWWSWTAPLTGRAIVELTNFATYVTNVNLFTGSELGTLVRIPGLVGEDESSPSGVYYRRTIAVTAGVTYHIAVSSSVQNYGGNFVLNLAAAPAPSNDMFAAAETLTGATANANGTTGNATRETGEPRHANPGSGVGTTVWWKWTAPFNGKAIIDQAGSNSSVVIAVYTGTSLADLVRIWSSLDPTSGPLRTFPAVSGSTYYIAADKTYETGSPATVKFSVTVLPSPVNDRFADRIVLTGSSIETTGTNVNATREPGEPVHHMHAPGSSAWWTWTAPTTGTAVLHVGGKGPAVVVYTGDTLATLAAVPNAVQGQASLGNVQFHIEQGTTYQIAVDAWLGFESELTLALAVHEAPPNDSFSNPATIMGTAASVAGTNEFATGDWAEPLHRASALTASVWWTWTAPSDGTARFEVVPEGEFSPTISVYTGSIVWALTPIAVADQYSSAARVWFSATAGTTYAIVVTSRAGTMGRFTLNLALVEAPANDHFAHRTLLAGEDVIVAASNFGATAEPGELNPDNPVVVSSVWWTWTAAKTGTAIISTAGSSFSNVLTVFTGDSLGGLTAVQSHQGDNNTSQVVFPATAGVTYQILVNGVQGAMGGIVLRVQLVDPPPNDAFAQATSLTGTAIVASGDMAGATMEPGEPGAVPGGSSVWWKWTAPANGAVIVSSAGSSFPTRLAAYGGSSLSTLEPIIGDQAYEGLSDRPRILFHVTAGSSYHVVVSGLNSARGTVWLNITYVAPPANDAFANRQTISGRSAALAATNLGASPESGEPDLGFTRVPIGSVWWTWTAPASGTATVRVLDGLAPLVGVFTGNSLAGLTAQPDSDPGGSGVHRVFHASAGATYQIEVATDPWSTNRGAPFTLEISLVDAPVNDLFVDRVTLTGAHLSFPASHENATSETDEPNFQSFNVKATLWWTWTAPLSSRTVIRAAIGRMEIAVVRVFTGNSLATLEPVSTVGTGPANQTVIDAIAGTTYQIGVGMPFDALHPEQTLYIDILDSPPANDAFATRSLIEGGDVTVRGSSIGATLEAGEPIVSQSIASSSTWWRWTAPRSGKAVVDVSESDFLALAGVFTGNYLGALTSVAYTNRTQSGLARVLFDAVEGTTYQIGVYGYYGGMGNVVLEVGLHDPPPNDRFADRINLTGPSAVATGHNRWAGVEAGEVGSSFPTPSATVWWTWTAPATGVVAFDTYGSDFDTTINAYTGNNVASLQPLTARTLEQGWDGSPAFATYETVAGTVLQISVDSSGQTQGDIVLHAGMYAPPPNDNFTQRSILSGMEPTATGSNLGANYENFDPRFDYVFSTHSVWWTWTAPVSGPYNISTAGSDFDTLLGVFTGSEISNLRRVATNDGLALGARTGSAFVQATAGQSYEILVDGLGHAMGTVRLAIKWVGPVNPTVAVSAGEIAVDSPLILTATAGGIGPYTYQWLFDGKEIAGAASSTLVVPSIQDFHNGRYSVRISNSYGFVTTSPVMLNISEPSPSNARLANLSTRAVALTGDNVLIPGFVVAGPGNKQLLIRAVGPTLGAFGVSGTLPNPRLTLKRWNGAGYDDVATNDNWGTNTNAAAIIAKSAELYAFPLAAGSADAALLVDLAPGQYSAVAGDAGTGTGIAIVELYDADPNGGTARLINISNRGYVGTGDSIMIPGYVVSSEGPKTLLIRAVGPTLSTFGVSGVLADPTLSIYRRVQGTEELILTNDDWGTGPGAQRTRAVATLVQAFALPDGSKDAAFVVTLNPGVYTVHARGANNTTGVALVEVYAVP